MAKDLFSRYVWLLDTIKRYGRITRTEINECWRRSSFTDSDKPINRRTFYNYRQAVQELFDINIECDPATYEYYISAEDEHRESVTNWLLNSQATNGILTSARDVADRVFLEDVPSAREYLAIFIEALRASTTVKFDYQAYTRSRPTTGVVIEPYFVKIFKQRWYVVGRVVSDNKVKTYALDRMSRVKQQSDKFEMPVDFQASEYFKYAFGITVDQSEPKDITIRVEPTLAKYLRALPLHHSQQEMMHDQYSMFTYRMCVTPDLVTELLSYGSRLTVVSPKELRSLIANELDKALHNYRG